MSNQDSVSHDSSIDSDDDSLYDSSDIELDDEIELEQEPVDEPAVILPWTTAEDEKLKAIVKKYGSEHCWAYASAVLIERSMIECQQRWERVLKRPVSSRVVKGSWTKTEDNAIKDWVKKYGVKRWTLVARCVPGRTGKQCRERWHNHLDPNINKSHWTEEEDYILLRLHKSFGNKWAEIAKFMSGRTDNAIKNHWNSTLRRKILTGEEIKDCPEINRVLESMNPQIAAKVTVINALLVDKQVTSMADKQAASVNDGRATFVTGSPATSVVDRRATSVADSHSNKIIPSHSTSHRSVAVANHKDGLSSVTTSSDAISDEDLEAFLEISATLGATADFASLCTVASACSRSENASEAVAKIKSVPCSRDSPGGPAVLQRGVEIKSKTSLAMGEDRLTKSVADVLPQESPSHKTDNLTNGYSTRHILFRRPGESSFKKLCVLTKRKHPASDHPNPGLKSAKTEDSNKSDVLAISDNNKDYDDDEKEDVEEDDVIEQIRSSVQTPSQHCVQSLSSIKLSPSLNVSSVFSPQEKYFVESAAQTPTPTVIHQIQTDRINAFRQNLRRCVAKSLNTQTLVKSEEDGSLSPFQTILDDSVQSCRQFSATPTKSPIKMDVDWVKVACGQTEAQIELVRQAHEVLSNVASEVEERLNDINNDPHEPQTNTV